MRKAKEAADITINDKSQMTDALEGNKQRGVINKIVDLKRLASISRMMDNRKAFMTENVFVTNSFGDKVDFDEAAKFMDLDIMEELRAKGDAKTAQEFFDAYAKAHKQKWDEEWTLAKSARIAKFVKNRYGDKVDFDEAVELMDNDIREEIHSRGDAKTDQAFFDAYAKAHKQKWDEVWILEEETPQLARKAADYAPDPYYAAESDVKEVNDSIFAAVAALDEMEQVLDNFVGKLKYTDIDANKVGREKNGLKAILRGVLIKLEQIPVNPGT